MMDPFEAAFEDSPPQSPEEAQPHADAGAHDSIVGAEDISNTNAAASASASASAAETPPQFPPPTPPPATTTTAAAIEIGGGSSSSNAPKNKEKEKEKEKEDEEEEEEEDVELSKFPSSADPHKSANMQAILSQFTEEQMSRYESFRRSGFQKSSMKRLLVGITGTQKISVPITIVVSGIAKMFVGDVVETARIVMTERKETGPIRPCHLREAYRRLKLEGKTFKRPGSRLFR